MKRMAEKKNYETTDGLVQIRKKKKETFVPNVYT